MNWSSETVRATGFLAASAAAWVMCSCSTPADHRADSNTATRLTSNVVAPAAEGQGARSGHAVNVQSSTPSNPQADIQSLRARAELFWAAKKDENWGILFAFQHKDMVGDATADDYANWSSANEPFVIRRYHIKDVAVDGVFGWVQVECDLSMRKFPNAPQRTITRWDRWCLDEGAASSVLGSQHESELGGERPVADSQPPTAQRLAQWIPVPAKYYDFFPMAPGERDAAAESRLSARYEISRQLRLAGEYEKLYELTDPMDRPQVLREDFLQRLNQLKYLDAKALWTQVPLVAEFNRYANVPVMGTVRAIYQIKLTDPSLTKMPANATAVNELWVQRDGEWYMELVVNEAAPPATMPPPTGASPLPGLRSGQPPAPAAAPLTPHSSPPHSSPLQADGPAKRP